MSTNAKNKEKELVLESTVIEDYAPEVETSIWYN